VATGSPVEFGDEVAGGGEHDRVQALGTIVLPASEDVLGDGGEVTDMDALVVKVEPDRLGSAVA
jgi:hypothetical protein